MGRNNSEIMPTPFWSLSQSGHSYDLCLFDNQWVIRIDNDKTVLRYNEERKMWIGISNGKMIKIAWPTFKDIVQQYLIEVLKSNGIVV